MPLDLMGEHGGQLAAAFGAGCISTAGVLIGAGKWIWEKFGDKRIAELEAQLRDSNEECRAMEHRLNDRIKLLEGMLFGLGPSVQIDSLAPGAIRIKKVGDAA